MYNCNNSYFIYIKVIIFIYFVTIRGERSKFLKNHRFLLEILEWGEWKNI